MTLHRVRDEKDWDYIGPTKGIVVYLHVNCEPVRLEFDRDLYIQEFTKTQFAGVHVHVQALKLFKAVQPLFLHLSVEDEAEYWETRNTQTLTEHFENCDERHRSGIAKVALGSDESQDSQWKDSGPNYLEP